MWSVFRSGERPIRDIPEGKKKRYKIACAEKIMKIHRLSYLWVTCNPLSPLRYKNSSPPNLLF